MKSQTIFKTITTVASILLLFSSCQKGPEDLLVGQWIVNASEDSIYNEYTDCYDVINDINVGICFTFNADRSILLDYGDGFTETATWFYDNDILTITFPDGYIDSPRILRLDERRLTLHYDLGQINGHSIYSTLHLIRNE